MRDKLGRLGALTGSAALLVAVATGGTAAAQTAAPAPCPGAKVISDAKDDQSYAKAFAISPVEQSSVAAPASYDARKVFLTFGNGPDGKKQFRVHMQIENLTAEQINEPWANDIRYIIELSYNDTMIRPTAVNADGEWSYLYNSEPFGTPSESPVQRRQYMEETETTGAAIMGPQGIVSIDVPLDVLPGLKAGDKIDVTSLVVAHTGTNVFGSGGSIVDSAPDDRSFVSIPIMECEPPATTKQDPVLNQPKQGETPNQSGNNNQGQSGDANKAPASTKKKSKKAKKCKKARGKAKGHAKKGAKKCAKAKKRKRRG